MVLTRIDVEILYSQFRLIQCWCQMFRKRAET